MSNVLPDQRFEDLTKKLIHLHRNLANSKQLWDAHINDVLELYTDNFDLNKEQEEKYSRLCEIIGEGLLDLVVAIESAGTKINKFAGDK